jgi:hypothetical protein
MATVSEMNRFDLKVALMAELWSLEMEGRSILDIGGYDGRAAILALDAGARTAIVVDNEQWKQYEWGELTRLHHKHMLFVEWDFLDWVNRADIVLCFRVLYHLRDPLRGLDQLRFLTREALVISSSFVPEGEAGSDGWKWYPDGQGHENGTVWARPTKPTLKRELEMRFGEVVEDTSEGFAEDECRFICRIPSLPPDAPGATESPLDVASGPPIPKSLINAAWAAGRVLVGVH